MFYPKKYGDPKMDIQSIIADPKLSTEAKVIVINTITSPKRAFMRQESKRAKLCVNHATQGLTLFHGLYPRQASLYPVFLSAPTWKRLPQPSQTGNKRKAQDTCKNHS